MRILKRTLIALAVLIVGVVGACQIFLPERYAFNAPIMNMLLGRPGKAPTQDLISERLTVPNGFGIAIWAEEIGNARFLRFTPTGDLLVSTPRSGEVRLLFADDNGDGRADGSLVLLSGLNRPHGMDLRGEWLYVGETDAIGRIRFDAQTRSVEGDFQRIVTGLPTGGNHWTRTIRFGPDGLMYVSVGSSCNACIEDDPRRAAMLRYQPDGTGEAILATGLRNAVGFAWQPSTGDLYATDNGRDLLGDDFPPCELNRIEDGAFYGWPMINGTGSLDPDHGPGNEYRLAKAVDPAHEFRAHNAPLGITFVTGEQVPPAYREAALVALHGSWNRTSKDGYKVVSLHWRADGTIEERDFAAGFEVDGDVIGRPVDVAEGPDGAFYVSDDYAGVIWRVAYGDARVAPAPPVAADARVAPAPPVAADARVAPARPPVAAAEPARESTPAAPAATPGSDSDQTQRVTRGRDVYEANACAGCHDPERATPGVVVRPLQGLRARYTAGSLMALLVTPPPPMPVPSISRGERVDLALFLLAEFR